jgi:hypothetical protein
MRKGYLQQHFLLCIMAGVQGDTAVILRRRKEGECDEGRVDVLCIQFVVGQGVLMNLRILRHLHLKDL